MEGISLTKGTIEERNWDMRVRSITKIQREKEDSETIVYRLMARDAEGINEIIIVSAQPFKGVSAKDGVIQVVLKNSQMSLDEFKPDEEEED